MNWLPLIGLPSAVMAFRSLLEPWMFMWSLSASIYLGLKWLTWHKMQSGIVCPAWRSAAYLLLWPGMDARAFFDETKHPVPPQSRDWLWAGFNSAFGLTLVWFVARTVPREHELLRGWIGLVGLVLLLHFGIFQLASLFWQSRGVWAAPIMSAPLRSQSLSEFWGKRWNMAFRDLAHELIWVPVRRKFPAELAVLFVFLISGLVHDLVISLPARSGYGQPTAYFLLQGLGVMVQGSRFGQQFGLARGTRGRLFVLTVAGLPAFWLFHPAFVMRVIIPFMQVIHAL